MELPQRMRTLYRHWDYHLTGRENPISAYANELPKKLTWFVEERMRMLEKKLAGAPPPYSDDPILSAYRFCNIFREFDRQTIEFHEHLNAYRPDFPLWLLNMLAARLIANTETVRAVGLLSFDAGENERWLERMTALPRPKFGTPYVFPVSTILKSATPTRETFLARYAPAVMPRVAREIGSWKDMPVQDGLARVLGAFGFNLSFLWTEVLIDTAYQYPERIDLFGAFPVGPGSLPTFRRIAPGETPSEAVAGLARKGMTAGLTCDGRPIRLSAENWEGIGCEFRKYTNLSGGAGRRRIYRARSAPLH